MKDYSKYIKNLADNDESMLFQNSSPKHAAVVLANIFNKSKSELRIYAGDLCGEVSHKNDDALLKSAYINELTSFIDRGGNLKIILEEFNEELLKTELYSKLNLYSAMYPSKIKVKILSKNSKTDDFINKYHYTVGDNNKFRFENDTKKYIAVGSFNNIDVSKKLIDSFDLLFNNDYLTQNISKSIKDRNLSFVS